MRDRIRTVRSNIVDLWGQHPVALTQLSIGLVLLGCSALIGLRERTEFSDAVQGWLLGPGAAGVVIGLGSTILKPREGESSVRFWAACTVAVTVYTLCLTLGVLAGWTWVLSGRVYDLQWTIPTLLYLSSLSAVFFAGKDGS